MKGGKSRGKRLGRDNSKSSLIAGGKMVIMVEGKGYCGRRIERLAQKKVTKLIEDKDNIVIIPDRGKSDERAKNTVPK